MLILIFGMLTFKFTFDAGSIDFNWFIGVMVLSYSYLQIYSTGAFVFKLVMPMGAVIYFILIRLGVLGGKKEQRAQGEALAEGAEPVTESSEKNDNE